MDKHDEAALRQYILERKNNLVTPETQRRAYVALCVGTSELNYLDLFMAGEETDIDRWQPITPFEKEVWSQATLMSIKCSKNPISRGTFHWGDLLQDFARGIPCLPLGEGPWYSIVHSTGTSVASHDTLGYDIRHGSYGPEFHVLKLEVL